MKYLIEGFKLLFGLTYNSEIINYCDDYEALKSDWDSISDDFKTVIKF